MSEEIIYKGHCYCGGIEFTVRKTEYTRPLYCHCESCRRAHSAPLYHCVYVEKDAFQITKGKELVQEYRKTEGKVQRNFCKQCGSKVFNTLPYSRPGLENPLGFFPALLEENLQHPFPEQFIPVQHLHPSEATIPLCKFEDGVERRV